MPREFSEAAEAAIAEYLDKTDEGEAIDREAFIDSHAEVADELRSFFANDDQVGALVGEVRRSTTPVGEPAEGDKADTVRVSRAVNETTDFQRPKHDTVVDGLVCPGDFGRYRLEKQLGEGAMGSVFLAEDTQLGRKVALKVPKVDSERSADFLERFLREARAAATLSHPNICSVFDVRRGEDRRHALHLDGVREGTAALRLHRRQAATRAAGAQDRPLGYCGKHDASGKA